MPKWKHCDQAGNLLGLARHKVEHLVKLGYTVRVLQPRKVKHWQKRKKERKEIEWMDIIDKAKND